MKWTPRHRLRFGLFRTRRQLEDELEDEFDFHIDMRTEELTAAGFSPEEARSRALQQFGDRRVARRVCHQADLRRERSMKRNDYLLEFVQDVRHALRQLRRSPAFAVTLALTLAVGIGATTAVFTTADFLLLRSLPYFEPERVVTLWEEDLETGERREVASGNFVEWKERSTAFSALGLADPWGFDLVPTDGRPEEVGAWRVTEGFIEALGVSPVLGRPFANEEFLAAAGSGDTHEGSGSSVLISRHFWQTRFASDPEVFGRSLLLNGNPTTIVGVVSEELEYPKARDLWVPKILVEHELRDRTSSYMHAVGRLAPGVSLEQAQAEMDRIARDLAEAFPATNAKTGVRLVPLTDEVVGNVRPALLVLLGAVAFVLLVACINVAGLLLAHNANRQRELGIRAALGAGRGRLARQLVTESLVVSSLGGLLGIGLAALALRAIVVLGPADLPRKAALGIDMRILAFTAGVTLVAALLAGLTPALQAARSSSQAHLRSSGRSSRPAADTRFRSALVTLEIALSVALLIGAGLLGRSFLTILETDLGFEPDHRATLQAFLWDNNPTPAARYQRARAMLERMEAVPGVERAALATAVPYHPFAADSPSPIGIPGQAPLPSGQQRSATAAVASRGYFETLGIPLIEGRTFDERDVGLAVPVAVINESLARLYFQGENPIGKRIVVGVNEAPRERQVVGIVGDVRSKAFDAAPRPEIFIPFGQNGSGSVIFVVDTGTDAAAVLPQLREAIWEVDGDQAIYHSESLRALVEQPLASRRFALVLLGAFSITALVLATVGIYGLISFSTNHRRTEIGIRMAIGARKSDVIAMIVGQGLKLGLVGVALGLGLAFALTRFLVHMLHGITPTDPWTFLGLGALMLAIAVLATYIPARRAAGNPPLRALRDG